MVHAMERSRIRASVKHNWVQGYHKTFWGLGYFSSLCSALSYVGSRCRSQVTDKMIAVSGPISLRFEVLGKRVSLFLRSPRGNLKACYWLWLIGCPVRRMDCANWLSLGHGDGAGCTETSWIENRGQCGILQEDSWAWVPEKSGWILNT